MGNSRQSLWQQLYTKVTHSYQKKASNVGPLLVPSFLGPVWTPRRYDRMAEEGYNQNVIVYRCIQLVARGVASVPWLLYRKCSKKYTEEIEQHSLLDLLGTPNPRQGGASFIESVVSYLLLSGNAYVEAVWSEDGQISELYPLRPDRMRIIPGKSGVPGYFEYDVNGKRKRFEVDQDTGRSNILHLKLFHPLNDWYGMSPIEAAAKSIDQHSAVSSHNLALLQNGGRPSGALLVRPDGSGKTLTEEQRKSLREDLRHLYEGSANAGRIMVLEGDCDWRDIGLSPKAMDYIEGKNLSAREICQAFGVPPMLAGIPGDATYANYREARFHLWEDTILPLLEFLVNELNHWLTPCFGDDLLISYDHDGIPALAPKREAAWDKIIAADFLTINEKRDAVGYGPIEGGDIFIQKEGGDETC